MAQFATALAECEDRELEVCAARARRHPARRPSRAFFWGQVCETPVPPAEASALYSKMMLLYLIQNAQ